MPKNEGTLDTYLPPRVVIEKYGVSRTTLVRWAQLGKIKSIRAGGGLTSAHRYSKRDLERFFGEKKKSNAGTQTILYARVSSSKQKEDLQRQVELLKHDFPEYTKCIKDVGSGLNFKRRGLTTLLDAVERGDVSTVVVTYKDRLARFGVELLERSFRAHGVTLNVLQRDKGSSKKRELTADLLSVCNFFVAQNNGRRAASLRRARRTREPAVPKKRKRASKGNKSSRKRRKEPQDQTSTHSSAEEIST